MRDIAISLPNRPGALADVGEALGRAGVSIEGGGVFTLHDSAVAHFLVRDATAARAALADAGINVLGDNDVLMLTLRQDEPGQLGLAARMIAAAGVNIAVQYSDHDGHLILVVDDLPRGQAVSVEWAQRAARPRSGRRGGTARRAGARPHPERADGRHRSDRNGAGH